MNQILFEKIVGQGFHTTSYKVASLKDLKAVIAKQEKNLNHRVFNDSGEYYKLKSSEISPDNNGILELTVSIALGELYSYDLNHLDSYKKEILAKLAFKIDQESKLNFFKNEFLRIENLFLGNPYFELLSPDNYFNEINSYEFISNLWYSLKRNNYKAFCKWKKILPKNIDDIFYGDQEYGESIRSLFIYLGEYTTLKIQKLIFVNQTEQNDIVCVGEFNPLVFTNPEAEKLFLFCLSHYEKEDISKVLLSKYFQIFQLEGYILEKVKYKYFFSFIQNKFEINMKRIEPYTSDDSVERKEFESLQNQFV